MKKYPQSIVYLQEIYDELATNPCREASQYKSIFDSICALKGDITERDAQFSYGIKLLRERAEKEFEKGQIFSKSGTTYEPEYSMAALELSELESKLREKTHPNRLKIVLKELEKHERIDIEYWPEKAILSIKTIKDALIQASIWPVTGGFVANFGSNYVLFTECKISACPTLAEISETSYIIFFLKEAMCAFIPLGIGGK